MANSLYVIGPWGRLRPVSPSMMLPVNRNVGYNINGAVSYVACILHSSSINACQVIWICAKFVSFEGIYIACTYFAIIREITVAFH